MDECAGAHITREKLEPVESASCRRGAKRRLGALSLRALAHRRAPRMGSGSKSDSVNGEDHSMNWDTVKGNWTQAKGKVKTQWGKLADDDLDVIAGNRDQLIGKIQEKYGISKDEAEKQLKSFEHEWKN